MNAFNFARAVWRKMANDPMAAINAKRVADMKAMAAKVRGASGTPNPMGNGMNGTHSWSGRVMPGGDVQGAQYTPPSTPIVKQPAAPSAPLQKATPNTMLPNFQQRKELGASGMGNLMGAGNPPAPAPRPAPMSMLSSQPMQPKVTTTPVDNAALRKQLQQAQQQSAPLTKQPATINKPATNAFPAATGMGMASAGAAATQPMTPSRPRQPRMITTDNNRQFDTRTRKFTDGAPGGFAPPPRPGAGGGAPMAALDPNNLPANVIKTDNGRLFDTAAKKFLDGQPGGFAR